LKKRKFRILIPIIIILLLLTALNSPLNYTFEKNENGYAVTGRRIYFPIMIIPNSHNFKDVTAIGSGAFEWSELLFVYIPDSVKIIDGGAFANNKNLQSVYIGDSVEYIGIDAFAYCNDLQNVRMSPAIRNIDNLAFEECSELRKIEFPQGLTRIGACAFSGCHLTEVTLPQTLSEIGENAFAGCAELSEGCFNNSHTEH